MAATLKLSDGITVVDLLDILTSDGWSTTTSNEKVWENFSCVYEGTDAAIRSLKNDIDYLAQRAYDYHKNKLRADAVWLKAASDGEPLRKALVYEIQSEILADESLSSPLLGLDVALINLAVLRHRDWEVNSASAGDITIDQHSVSGAGGIVYLTSPHDRADNGTSDGRIKSTYITMTGVSQAWLGIHPAYAGYKGLLASQTLPLTWEAELSGNSATSGDASAGEYDYLNIGSVAVQHDYYLSTYCATTDLDDMVGKYLILGRLSVDATTTTAVVELNQYSNGGLTYAGTTIIEGETAWLLYPLGYIEFPPVPNRDDVVVGLNDFALQGFTVSVKSPDDSGTLYLDCFYLIPAEHMFYVKGWDPTATYNSIRLFTNPDDSNFALGQSSTAHGGLDSAFEDWLYPIDAGVLMFCAQADTVHSLSTTATITMTVGKRWKTYYQTGVVEYAMEEVGSASRSKSPSASLSPSPSASVSPTPSPTKSPSHSKSPSASRSPSKSNSPSRSPSASISPSQKAQPQSPSASISPSS